MDELKPATVRALLDAARPEMMSGWDHGSRVVSQLKACGWIEGVKVSGATRYRLTAIGRDALELSRRTT